MLTVGERLARRFRDAREQCGFFNSEVFGLLAEVCLGSGLESV